MKQKTISLPEDVYNKLKAEKGPEESFPQLILRLLKKEKIDNSIELLAGAFEEESEEWGKIEKLLYEDRLRSRKRKINLDEA